MAFSSDTVFAKTPQGSDEIATRRHGLSMRMRQLLILIDGRRTVSDLARLISDKDLGASLATLEEQGFASPTGTAAGAARSAGGPATATLSDTLVGSASAGAGGSSPRSAPPGAATAAAPAAATVQTVAPASTVASSPAAATTSGAAATSPAGPHAAATAVAQRRDLETVRRQLVRRLVDAVGPGGDDMAVRIERCRSVHELRELLPAVITLVEALRGRSAMQAFVQQVGEL